MAALTHLCKQDTTTRTAGTTAVELTDYTISWSDLTAAGFAAGDNVVIVVGVKQRASGTAISGVFAVGFGTTFAGRVEDATSSQRAQTALTTNGDQYLWVVKKVLVNNENIYFRGNSLSTGTASYDEFCCLILNWDELDANDKFHAEVTNHSGDAPAAYDASGASTNTPAAGDWLFIASQRALIDSTSADLYLAIHDGTSDISEVITEGESTNDERVIGTLAYKAGLGSGVTVRARYRTDDGTSHDTISTVIFGLRLNAFADHWSVQSSNAVTHTVVDTYSEFAGDGTYSLGNTGPFVVIGWPIHLINETTKLAYGRIQIGGSDWPTAGANRLAVRDNGANVRSAPLLFGYAASQSAGTLDIDLDCAEDADVTPSYSCTVQVAAAFSLELSALGGTITIDGDPAAQAADVDGAGQVLVSAAGALSSQAALVSGSATQQFGRKHGLYGGAALGEGAFGESSVAIPAVVTGAVGNLASQAATVAGTAQALVQASGALVSQTADVAGAAQVLVQASGALVSQDAEVAGTVGQGLVADGALAAQAATVTGAATVLVQASGALASQVADVDGTAGVLVAAAGALSSQAADVDGAAAVLVQVSGALASQAATVSGNIGQDRSLEGALASQDATVSGAATVLVQASGALASQAATVAGVAQVLGQASGALASQAAGVNDELPGYTSAGTVFDTAAIVGTWSVDVPAHNAGDLLLIVTLVRTGTGDGELSSIDTAGWTQAGGVGNTYGPAQTARLGFGWKIGDGAETSVSITTTGGGISGLRVRSRVFVFETAGAFASPPVQFIGAATAVGEGISTTVTVPTVTPGGMPCLAVAAFVLSAARAIDAPTDETGGDWIEPVDQSDGSNGTVGILTAEQADGATISGGTISNTNASWVGIGFGIVQEPAVQVLVQISGALVSQAATVTGTAGQVFAATGDLESQAATVSGAARVLVQASGALSSQAADVDGAAAAVATANGALASQAATASGAAQALVQISGALASQAATVSGTAGQAFAATGALASQAATVSAAAAVLVQASGALASQAAALAVSLTIPVQASGALASQAATVTGDATKVVRQVSGALASQAAEIDGAAVVLVQASGALEAQDADVTGAAAQAYAAEGALESQPATVSGRARITGHVRVQTAAASLADPSRHIRPQPLAQTRQPNPAWRRAS